MAIERLRFNHIPLGHETFAWRYEHQCGVNFGKLFQFEAKFRGVMIVYIHLLLTYNTVANMDADEIFVGFG